MTASGCSAARCSRPAILSLSFPCASHSGSHVGGGGGGGSGTSSPPADPSNGTSSRVSTCGRRYSASRVLTPVPGLFHTPMMPAYLSSGNVTT